jgi:hypothetical protein
MLELIVSQHCQAYGGNMERFIVLTSTAEWFVDIQDTARLHVAVLTNPDVVNERIILYAEHYTWK